MDPRAYGSSPSPQHAALAQFTPFSGRYARAGALLSDLDSIMSHSPITPEDGPAVLESGPHVKQYVQQLMALGSAAQASRSVQDFCVSAYPCKSLRVEASRCKPVCAEDASLGPNSAMRVRLCSLDREG